MNCDNNLWICKVKNKTDVFPSNVLKKKFLFNLWKVVDLVWKNKIGKSSREVKKLIELIKIYIFRICKIKMRIYFLKLRSWRKIIFLWCSKKMKLIFKREKLKSWKLNSIACLKIVSKIIIWVLEVLFKVTTIKAALVFSNCNMINVWPF